MKKFNFPRFPKGRIGLNDLEKLPAARQYPSIVRVKDYDTKLGGPFGMPRITYSIQFQRENWPIWQEFEEILNKKIVEMPSDRAPRIMEFVTFEDAAKAASMLPLKEKLIYRIVIIIHLIQ
jgi:hypothetical protein